MRTPYNPNQSPRVIIIQKLYGKFFNNDADLTFSKHRFKKFIKDVVLGTIERDELIQEEVRNYLSEDLQFTNLALIIFFVLLILFYFILYLKVKFEKNLFLLFLIFLASSLPVILLSHISELYTYHSIFFFCLLLLILLSKNQKYNFIKKILVFLFIIVSCLSSFIKINNVNKNSILSKSLFNYFEDLKSEEK